MLKRLGEVSAFEHDEVARGTASARSGIDVLHGTLPDAVPTFGKSFDVVVLLDVLEHVEEDRQSLETLAGRLARDGMFLITVPALPELWSDHDVVHQHKRRYTKESLTQVCEAAGLEVRDVRYYNALLLPLAKWHRQRSKARQRRSNEDELPPAPINGLLYAVFAMEAALLGRIRFRAGLSLIAVVAKR